jgi:hypothetical protein
MRRMTPDCGEYRLTKPVPHFPVEEAMSIFIAVAVAVLLGLPLGAVAQAPNATGAPTPASMPFLTAGTYKVAAPNNSSYVVTLVLISVTREGVTGTFVSDPYSKCRGTFPITSSVVQTDTIVMRSWHAESPNVPMGCDRLVELKKASDKITATISNWKGRPFKQTFTKGD